MTCRTVNVSVAVNLPFKKNDIDVRLRKNVFLDLNRENMIGKAMSFDTEKLTKSYTNSTIAEALCEIHFDCQSLPYPDNETILKALKAEFGSEYPDVTEQQLKQYRTEITDMGISVDEAKVHITRLIFKHKERQHLIQLLPNILTINEIGRYPTWTVFLQDISRAWMALKTRIPVTSKRLGLRYINLIPRNDTSEPLSKWFKPNKFYPNGILDNSKEFLSRNEMNFKQCRVIVTLSEPVQGENKGSIIFDIDVISSPIDQKVEWSDLCKRLEQLHTIAWEIFSTSLTAKYEALLRGEFL
jgi:uncharacterized protein (TIGR04255 family)